MNSETIANKNAFIKQNIDLGNKNRSKISRQNMSSGNSQFFLAADSSHGQSCKSLTTKPGISEWYCFSALEKLRRA